MSEYEPAAGDRVRVTFEGEVDLVGFGGGFRVVTLGGRRRWISTSDQFEIEKIAPPMPEWRDGDVIKVRPYRTAYRIGGGWVLANGRRHALDSESGRKWLQAKWEAGEVTHLVGAGL